MQRFARAAPTLLPLLLLLATSCAARVAGKPPLGAEAAIALAEDRRDVQAVLAFAYDRDPHVRARAARALGRIRGSAALPAVKMLAFDDDPSVATAALYAWGWLGGEGLEDPTVARHLFERADTSGRIALADALGRASSESHARRLFELYADVKDSEVVGAAALASARALVPRFSSNPRFHAAVDAWLDRLGNAARDPATASVRWKIAYALSASTRLAASDALLPLANDPDPWTRLFAARGLAARPDTSRFTEADAARAYSREPAPSPAAIEARSGEVHTHLTRLALDPNPRVACEVALRAREPRDRTLFEAFARNLDRPETFLRRACARALGRGAARSHLDVVLPALDKASRDPEPSVKADAILGFAELELEEARGRIAGAASDPHPFLRERAASAAPRLPRDRALALLRAAASDPEPRVASAAAAALGSLDGNDVETLLRALLAHERGLVREAAAEAIQGRRERAADLLADAAAILDSLDTARGPDLAEPRATLLATMTEVEAYRRGATRSIEVTTEAAFRRRVAQAVEGQLADPDPTVRAKARRAAAVLGLELDRGTEQPPGRPNDAALPGVNVPAFERPPRVRIVTTRGPIDVELFHEDAPAHAESFLRIAARGAYDGTVWHRVELNFVVQGGDPLGDGTGGLADHGGTLRDEISPRGFVRGTLGMPKTDEPDSGGCQLFFSLIPTPHLDGRYTAFGQVTGGFDALDALDVGDRIERIEVLDPGRG